MSNQDWTGNKNSVWKTLGASNHTKEEREANDYYATSAVAIDLLKKKVDLPKQILEPACGAGHLSIRLEELGHEVYSSDLIDRGFGKTQDFFAMTKPPFEEDFAIVTNPPYKYATPFIKHALELVPEGSLVCMFLKTTFAESKGRYRELFVTTPPTGFYNASSVSCVPKTATSRRCAGAAGAQQRMPGGHGSKAITDKQLLIG